MEDKKYIELCEVRSMIYVPQNAVEIKMNCQVYQDGELKSVVKTLNLQEIQKAIADAEKNYIEDDDVFYLTEKGAALADNL